MLFEQRFAAGLRDGTITLTFRRWKRSHAVAGHRYRTIGGIIEVEAVDIVEARSISDAEARASGYPDAATLIADLQGSNDLPVRRIQFHHVDGPDPRDQLARTTTLTDDDVADLDRRLERLDRASAHGPWTIAVLRVIAERPGVRAPDLAAGFGRDTQPFKIDVRKLKNLGLTLSLRVGYELSPRGREYLGRTTTALD